ncbi:MAG: EamA family transporter [Clostridia bacterium]|nr:EamA family transporter [Clostridia bacterium]
MTKEILIILSCVPLYVINSFCDKLISTKNGNEYNFIYNAVKFLICSLCMLPLLFIGSAPVLTWGCLVCGIACGLMYAISKTIMLKGYEITSVAFMTLCHSAGMILPCIIGHFFWHEKLTVFSSIGILLAITSIVLLKSAKSKEQKFDIKGAIYGATIFLSSAGVMIIQKLMGIYFVGESIGAYNFYSFFVAFLLIFCLMQLKTKRNKKARDSITHSIPSDSRKDKRLIIICAFLSAVSLSIISFVMTALSGVVPSVILFPLFNGLGIIFVCIVSVFSFKEKLTPMKIIGLILGIFGLCLIYIK